MPLIDTEIDFNKNAILTLRIFSGLVWLGTVFRRLGPNYGDFEERISSMAEGNTLFPSFLMEFAVNNWFFIYLLVISLELLSSLSLLTGTFARGGAFIATVNGFGIGMAGIGLGFVDLIIPWSVALVTLFLLLFTHPGRYKGYDEKLSQKDLPKYLKILT